MEKLPEGHALRRQLREHTNARITGYLTPPKRTRVANFFAKPGRRRLAFTVVLVAAGLAVSGAVLKGDRSASSVVVALMLVLSSAAALGEVTARNRREAAQRLSGRTLEEWERLLLMEADQSASESAHVDNEIDDYKESHGS